MAGLESVQENVFKKVIAPDGVEFLVSSTGKVPWSTLEGKTVCLFFSANWCRPCRAFTPQLVQLYNRLKKNGQKIEIVFVSSDRDEYSYKEHFKEMPWLSIPFDLNLYRQLARRFNVNHLPALTPLSSDGKLIEEDAVGLVEDYGSDAFPFTRVRKDELRALDERKRRGGKLEELLAHDERNYIISRDGKKVQSGLQELQLASCNLYISLFSSLDYQDKFDPVLQISVSELIGKTVGLYFGAHWCPPARIFTEQLLDCYSELVTSLKQQFEVVFISTDRDHDEFICSLSTMPWPAIPYEDKSRQDLKRIFDIKGIPALVLIGPDGKTITTNGRAMVSLYGHMAFPFTEPRIAGIEAALRKEGERLPRQVQDPRHVHELKLDMAKAYLCDACRKQGRFWAFSCDVCDYDLHPNCVQETF